MNGQRTVRPLEWSFRPRLPAVLYLASDRVMAQNLRVVALDGGVSHELLVAPSTILDLATSPDGLQVALAILREGGKSELWLIDSATGKQRQTIDCMPSSCSSPVWSPDGRLLAYERNEPTPNRLPGLDRVWLYDLASGKTEPVFQDNQVLGSRPVWSSNGRRLAFFDWNAHSVHIIDLSDRNAFLVPSPLGDAGSLSPDGMELVYTNRRAEDRQSSAQLWLAHLEAHLNLAPLIQGSETVQDKDPTWSPDGQWIAFLRRRLDQPQGNQVMLYRLNTSELRQLTNETNYSNTELKWDMTGQHLLIQRFESSGTNPKPQIWAYNVITGRLTRVVDNGLKGEWLP
jgi:Tol biopolymer transport system component